MWFHGPRDTDKFIFERVLTLEDPTAQRGVAATKG